MLARRALLLAALALGSHPLAAAAQDLDAPFEEEAVPPPPAPSTIERGVLELRVNGRRSGESIVLLRGAELLVPVDDLLAAGLVRLRAPRETHDGIAYLSFPSAADGLTHTIDMEELALRIDAPASAFGTSTLDLSPRAPEGMRHVSDPSLFVNYAPRLVDFERIEGFGELGLSLGPALGLGTMSHDPDHGAVRLLTQVLIDVPDLLARVIVGDTVASSGALGGGAMLGGVSIASNLDLDPYLVRLPTLGFGGSVTSPSTLEVYVNDTLVRSTPVAPGEFNVANLPPVAGAGSTRYVIRDALGHERSVQSPFYATSGVIAPGLSDYAYAIGFARERYGVESLAYGDPVFIGRHRYGFSDAVTAGLRLEVDHDQLSGGLGVTLAPGLGELELALGASATWDGRAGASGLVGYSYLGRPFSLGTVLRMASPEYTTVSLGAGADRYLVEHATTASLALTTSFSVAARVIYALPRDRDHIEAQLGLDLSTRLSPELVLTVGYTCRYTRDAPWVQQVMAALRVALPEHHSGSVGTRITSTGDAETHAQLSLPIRARTGLGYQIGGALGTATRFGASVRARTGHGSLDATYAYAGDRHSTVVRAAMGVAIVPGEGVFFRDPLEQSNAVVHLPGVAGARVYANNQPMGRTDASGRLFVQGLQPFQANRLRVEAADLPIELELDELEHVIAPSFRGVARVTFAGRRARVLRGRAAIGSGSRQRWASLGEIEVHAGAITQTSLLGIGGELELDRIPPGTWRATVRSPEGECDLTFVVPEGDEPFVDLGTLRCPDAPNEVSP